jgi:hypothetical protein
MAARYKHRLTPPLARICDKFADDLPACFIGSFALARFVNSLLTMFGFQLVCARRCYEGIPNLQQPVRFPES